MKKPKHQCRTMATPGTHSPMAICLEIEAIAGILLLAWIAPKHQNQKQMEMLYIPEMLQCHYRSR